MDKLEAFVVHCFSTDIWGNEGYSMTVFALEEQANRYARFKDFEMCKDSNIKTRDNCVGKIVIYKTAEAKVTDEFGDGEDAEKMLKLLKKVDEPPVYLKSDCFNRER